MQFTAYYASRASFLIFRQGDGTTTAPGYGNSSGYGNTTSSDYGDNNKNTYGSSDTYGSNKGDSTTGRLMEKAGNILHSDTLAGKGQQKRADAAANIGSTGSGDYNNY
jgi:hypothetical protein